MKRIITLRASANIRLDECSLVMLLSAFYSLNLSTSLAAMTDPVILWSLPVALLGMPLCYVVKPSSSSSPGSLLRARKKLKSVALIPDTLGEPFPWTTWRCQLQVLCSCLNRGLSYLAISPMSTTLYWMMLSFRLLMLAIISSVLMHVRPSPRILVQNVGRALSCSLSWTYSAIYIINTSS